jgi:hypothetical protein
LRGLKFIWGTPYNPSTWESKGEASQVWGQPGLCSETLSQINRQQ